MANSTDAGTLLSEIRDVYVRVQSDLLLVDDTITRYQGGQPMDHPRPFRGPRQHSEPALLQPNARPTPSNIENVVVVLGNDRVTVLDHDVEIVRGIHRRDRKRFSIALPPLQPIGRRFQDGVHRVEDPRTFRHLRRPRPKCDSQVLGGEAPTGFALNTYCRNKQTGRSLPSDRSRIRIFDTSHEQEHGEQNGPTGRHRGAETPGCRKHPDRSSLEGRPMYTTDARGLEAVGSRPARIAHDRGHESTRPSSADASGRTAAVSGNRRRRP